MQRTLPTARVRRMVSDAEQEWLKILTTKVNEPKEDASNEEHRSANHGHSDEGCSDGKTVNDAASKVIREIAVNAYSVAG